jgi:hypothetical protein
MALTDVCCYSGAVTPSSILLPVLANLCQMVSNYKSDTFTTPVEHSLPACFIRE